MWGTAVCCHHVAVVRDPVAGVLLTARSRVLLEKLTGFEPVNKFPVFYVT